MAKSTGLQCASFNCYSCSYNFIDHVRVPTKISFFCFPKNSQKGMLCVIWSNEERLKMVLESANPSIVWEAFSPWKKLQTSWRYSEKTDSVNQTSFTPLEQLYLEKHRKEPLRRYPRKKVKVADCSEQQYDVQQQDLFETDDNIQLDDSPVDFEKKNQGS